MAVYQSLSAGLWKVWPALTPMATSNRLAVPEVLSASNGSATGVQAAGVGVGTTTGVEVAAGGAPSPGCGAGVGVGVGVGAGVGGWPLSTHTSRPQLIRLPVVGQSPSQAAPPRSLSLTSSVHVPLLALPLKVAKLPWLGRYVPPLGD